LALALCAFLIFFLNHSGLSFIPAIVSPELTSLVNPEAAPYPQRTLSTRGSPSSSPAVSGGTRKEGAEVAGLDSPKEVMTSPEPSVAVAPRSLDRALNLGTPKSPVNRDSDVAQLAPVTPVYILLSRHQKSLSYYHIWSYRNHWRYNVATVTRQLVC
jgi:hypothetical protein